MLGAVQGANVVPLYIIARQTLRIDDYKLGAAALALLGQTGGLGLNLLGTHYYDNVMSVFVLTSLAILVVTASRRCAKARCGRRLRSPPSRPS